MTFAAGLVVVVKTDFGIIGVGLDVELKGRDSLGRRLACPVICELPGEPDVTLSPMDIACCGIPGSTAAHQVELDTLGVEIH